jgi:hypothetical protein
LGCISGCAKPCRDRALEDERLLILIHGSYIAGAKIYGSSACLEICVFEICVFEICVFGDLRV